MNWLYIYIIGCLIEAIIWIRSIKSNPSFWECESEGDYWCVGAMIVIGIGFSWLTIGSRLIIYTCCQLSKIKEISLVKYIIYPFIHPWKTLKFIVTELFKDR